MSPDRRLPRRSRALVVLLALLVLAGAAAAWALVPRNLGQVMVEQISILAPATPDGGSKPAPLATPERIAVTFVVPEDLGTMRARLNMGYVAARLTPCDGAGGAATEVVTQQAGYLGDYGRVTRLSAGAGGIRYRAVFDDVLTKTVGHRAVRTPARAAAGGLCFSLNGARMWFGQARSAPVPLDLPR